MRRRLALAVLAAALTASDGCRGRAGPVERVPGARKPTGGTAGVYRSLPTRQPPPPPADRPTPRRRLPD